MTSKEVLKLDIEKKWFGKETYKVSVKAMDVILNETKNPTYSQIEEILECMQDLAKVSCELRTQK